MKRYDNMVKNAAGRMVPLEVNGEPSIPFKGLGKYIPEGCKHAPKIYSSANYPPDGNKLVPSLKEALIKAGLKDGMVISTHHHLRNGDLTANEVFKIASGMGIKNLIWFP